jgi:hypothetical protein
MKTFIVFTDKPIRRHNIYGRMPRTNVQTKRQEIEAVDILDACQKAKEKHPGSLVTMVWPKVT